MLYLGSRCIPDPPQEVTYEHAKLYQVTTPGAPQIHHTKKNTSTPKYTTSKYTRQQFSTDRRSGGVKAETILQRRLPPTAQAARTRHSQGKYRLYRAEGSVQEGLRSVSPPSLRRGTRDTEAKSEAQ